MMRELMVEEFKTHGASEALVDKLLSYGEKPYLIWLVRKYVSGDSGVCKALQAFADRVGKPYTQVRYAYFSAPSRSKQEVQAIWDEDALLYVLSGEYAHVSKTLWGELAQYTLVDMKRLAVESLVRDKFDVRTITELLNVSISFVYRIRKEVLKDGRLQRNIGLSEVASA